QPRRPAIRAAIGADRHADAVLEPRVQIPVEEIGWLHDVHVRIDEPEAVLHRILPGAVTRRGSRTLCEIDPGRALRSAPAMRRESAQPAHASSAFGGSCRTR